MLKVSLPVFFLLFLWIVSELNAQVVCLKTQKGALFVCNRPGHYFTLELTGNKIRRMNTPEIVYFIDAQTVQFLSVPVARFDSSATLPRGVPKDILQKHRDFEIGHIQQLLGRSITAHSQYFTTASGRFYLLWGFDMPAREAEGAFKPAEKQLFVSTLVNDFVVLLNGTVTQSAPEDRVCRLLQEGMASLREYGGSIDIEAIQDSIRKGLGIVQ